MRRSKRVVPSPSLPILLKALFFNHDSIDDSYCSSDVHINDNNLTHTTPVKNTNGSDSSTDDLVDATIYDNDVLTSIAKICHNKDDLNYSSGRNGDSSSRIYDNNDNIRIDGDDGNA